MALHLSVFCTANFRDNWPLCIAFSQSGSSHPGANQVRRALYIHSVSVHHTTCQISS